MKSLTFILDAIDFEKIAYRSKSYCFSKKQKVLGEGLEPSCLTAYAPQTYVSAISPSELLLQWAVISIMLYALCKRVFRLFQPLRIFLP